MDLTPFESAEDGFDSVLLVTGLDATAEGLSVDGLGVWLDLGVSFVVATSDGSGRRAGLESVDGRGEPFEVPGVGRYAFVAIGERRSSVPRTDARPRFVARTTVGAIGDSRSAFRYVKHSISSI